MLELVEAVEARARSRPDEDFDAGIREEVERLFGRTDKANAVGVRFGVLTRLVEDEVVKSWALPGRRPDERPAADMNLLAMVAKSELVVCAGQFCFDLKPFTRYAGNWRWDFACSDRLRPRWISRVLRVFGFRD